jgi:hypothetical protein
MLQEGQPVVWLKAEFLSASHLSVAIILKFSYLTVAPKKTSNLHTPQAL